MYAGKSIRINASGRVEAGVEADGGDMVHALTGWSGRGQNVLLGCQQRRQSPQFACLRPPSVRRRYRRPPVRAAASESRVVGPPLAEQSLSD